MMIAQDVLRTIEKTDIASAYEMYYCEHPRMIPKKYRCLTIEELLRAYEDGVLAYIDLLLSLTPRPNPDHMMFYAYPCIPCEFQEKERSYALVSLDEVFEQGSDAEEYGWVLEDVEDVLGYYVAEVEMTQAYLPELMTNILFEMSFCG